MPVIDDLYFIPILAAALQEADVPQALRRALKEIEVLGGRTDYARGYGQYQAFMAAVLRASDARHLAEQAGTDVDEFAIGWAAANIDSRLAGGGNVESLIRSVREWKRLLECLPAGPSPVKAEAPVLLLTRDGVLLAKLVVEAESSHVLPDQVPGHYVISIDTGRILWEAELTAEDLTWTGAFPGRSLPLAAATSDHEDQPSQTISLLSGEIIVNVFPGLERGRLEIRVRPAGGLSP